MRHETFILTLCCLIALVFTCAVIVLFVGLYAIIGNVWLSLLLTLPLSALSLPLVFKIVDKIK